MKKILAIAAAGLLTVGFVGCNSKGAAGSSEAMDSLSMAAIAENKNFFISI